MKSDLYRLLVGVTSATGAAVVSRCHDLFAASIQPILGTGDPVRAQELAILAQIFCYVMAGLASLVAVLSGIQRLFRSWRGDDDQIDPDLPTDL